jgi:integrase
LLAFAQLPPTYQALIATAAMTGAKRGELLGLRWEDIDWIRGAISIRRGLQRVNKKLLAAGEFRNIEQIGASGLALAAHKSKKARREPGAPVKYAQDRLGCASATTTIDTYTHSISDEGRRYPTAVEAVLPFVNKLLLEGSSDEASR